MPYELTYDEGGFFLHFHGYVTIDEIIKAGAEINGHHKFDYHTYQIIDLLDVDLSSVSYEDTEAPATLSSIASRTNWGVRVALVATENYTLKMVNAFVEHARKLNLSWEFGVFPAREEALKWAQSRD